MEKTFVTYFPVEEGKSGIKIKPENKGKFTATKKRTGKTTEELIHSKNPLTRKRAIFAQNAEKWKHEEGGQIEYFQDGGRVPKYKIVKGDTLSSIAQKNGLTVRELLQLNPGITSPDKIQEGAVLNIAKASPVKSKVTTSRTTLVSKPSATYSGKVKKSYNQSDFQAFDEAYNAWEAQHPTVTLNGVTVKTRDLKNYIYDLALHESTFKKDAVPKPGSRYHGYFQIANTDGKQPFDDLIKHMNLRLARLTKEDVSKARRRGLSDAAILAKTHNQADHFVDWLWSGRDYTDAAGTLVSQYGNDWGTDLNILDRVVTQKALRPGQYVVLQRNQSYETYAPIVRYPGMTMDSIVKVLKQEYAKKYPQRNDPANPWVGDTLWIPQSLAPRLTPR